MILLETTRLVLREAKLEDSPFFFQLLNSANWIQYIGDRGIKTEADAGAYVEQSLIKSYIENDYGLYNMVLKENDESIGLCGLVNRPTLDHPDLGFAVLPAYEGQGYTTEAALATMDYAKTTLGLPIILGITSEDNHGSKKILEKAGLNFIGKRRFAEDAEETLVYSNESPKPS